MFKNYDKRGSVLLMVVGLLVILGTLGGTFLLVSSLDARQSKLLAGRRRAELIASGGVGKVTRILGQDLHFSTDKASAPYTAPNTPADTGNDAYKFFIDHTSVDTWLHGASQTSDVFGTGLGASSLVSTESDSGAGDAYLVPTGEFSDDGKQYLIAIKIIDMSGLLSLNTGGYNYIQNNPDTSQILKSPALIRLKEWMGNTSYDKIHKARCGVDYEGTNRDITIYDPECGRKLLSPAPQLNYMPFDIADEVYLRWLGSGRKASFGRVFDQINDDSVGTDLDKRRLLTTINSSRSLVRNPIAGVVLRRFDLSKTDALDSSGKEKYYTHIVLIAGSDNGEGCDILGNDVVTAAPIVIDNSSKPKFLLGDNTWRPKADVTGAYNDDSHLYPGSTMPAWWVFDDLPQANYRIWTSWGSPPPPTDTGSYSVGSVVPYKVYLGGTMTIKDENVFGTTYTYGGGDLDGTYVTNQTELPSDGDFEGKKWMSLGSHEAEGRLVVEIHGPQGVPAGEQQYAFADAVRIEGVNVALGSGSQPAAHLTANTWAAISEYQPDKAFPFRPPNMEAGKEYTTFGIQEQPFITEAFATHTTKTGTTTAEGVTTIVDADSWKWGAAIELMNFSSRAINLSDYRLVFDSKINSNTKLYPFPDNCTLGAATAADGPTRLVIYDFEAGKADTTAADVLGPNYNAASWKQFKDNSGDNKRLNFDNQVIRLVRIAKDNNDDSKTYKIPIDHIVAGDATKDMEYSQLAESVKNLAPPTAPVDQSISETNSSNCRRDDSAANHRYSVAKYWKVKRDPIVTATGAPNPIDAASHKLGGDNGITLTTATMTEADLKKGFRIKLRHGLLSGPGELSDLYLVGPILYDDPNTAPADLPGLLAREYATKESRGRANSHVENSEYIKDDTAAGTKWKAYPRKRGTTELAWPILLGELIETVPMDLDRGDSPNRIYGRVNVNTADKEVLKQLPWPTGINADSAASKIITYRNGKGGFVTPGEVALALEGLTGNDAAGEPLDRDSIYAAISSCVTVNSDMYAVTVRVQLGETPSANQVWYYVAVVDRGCAVFSTDKPAVLLFTPVN